MEAQEDGVNLEISVELKYSEVTSWSSLSTIGPQSPHLKAKVHITLFVHCLIVYMWVVHRIINILVSLYPFPIHALKRCPPPLREGIPGMNATPNIVGEV